MSTLVAVTLYSSGPACMACRQTKRHLDRRGIPYREVAIGDDDKTLAAIRYLGFTSAPVVCAATSSGEQSWHGYRPDRIDALAGCMAASGNGGAR